VARNESSTYSSAGIEGICIDRIHHFDFFKGTISVNQIAARSVYVACKFSCMVFLNLYSHRYFAIKLAYFAGNIVVVVVVVVEVKFIHGPLQNRSHRSAVFLANR